MFAEIKSAAEFAHHLPRYREIITILWKHGFGETLRLMVLQEFLGMEENPAAATVNQEPMAVRLRMALEELGPTFVKFGQVLSSRRDLLPHDVYLELIKLQDGVPPIEGERARALVEAELGQPIEKNFSSFTLSPLGGGSVAQVHAATLLDGTKVAIKVQRPNIAKVIAHDGAILHDLARFAAKHVPDLAGLNPVGVVQEFFATLAKELDFTHEAADAERFRKQFAGSATVVVPRVYHELTNSRILTMEFIHGLSVKDPEKLREAGVDPSALAKRFVELVYQQIFDFGFFHGDPHPGNIYILPGGVIGFIDFGMMGSLTHEFRTSLAQLLAGLAKKDHQRVMDAILQISEEGYTLEPAKMLTEVEAFSDLNLTQSLKDINLVEVLNKLLDLLRRNKLRMNGAFYLGIKVFTQGEAVGRALDPNLNFVELGTPFATRLILGKYKFAHVSQVLTRLLTSGLDFLDEFPADFRNIYQRIKAGNLSLPIEHKINTEGFEPMRKTLDSIANLIATAILTASVLICSSILILAHMPPVIWGVSLIGFLGLGWGAILGLRLAIHIWNHDGL
jgi:ubiquinone biosynthesis protein